MKIKVTFFSLLLLVLWTPMIASAEWRQLESKYHQNTFGTKYFYETNMSYAATSSPKTPVVVLWGKMVYSGKRDPEYSKLIANGCPAEMTSIEVKYLVDVNNKKTAIVYVALYDAQGRTLGTNEQPKAPYSVIPPDTGAEVVWRMVKELHEKGAIH
jgi:hypothetical protein